MNTDYLVRLVLLCLASFFLAHLVAGVLIRLVTYPAIRMAERVGPRAGARFLLTLRMFPLGWALVVVFGLCVPSYLALEPENSLERLRPVCLVAAALGAGVLMASILRTARAFVRSHRYIRQCRTNGRQILLAAESSPAWVVPGPRCLMALAGIVRPRVIVSRDVVGALQPHELAAAMRHEEAHSLSRDNLKRMLILLAPDVLPFTSMFQPLHRGWARLSEWAADDAAVGRDLTRSLSLASALLQVARMTSGAPSRLASAIVPDIGDVPVRIERLLEMAPVPAEPNLWMRSGIAGAVVTLAGASLAIGIQPAALGYVHKVFEFLMA